MRIIALKTPTNPRFNCLGVVHKRLYKQKPKLRATHFNKELFANTLTCKYTNVSGFLYFSFRKHTNDSAPNYS